MPGSPIRCKCGDQTYPAFNTALKSLGLFVQTTQSERQSARDKLKAGQTVQFKGLLILPVSKAE